jgi:hypothetical protein
LLPLLPGRPAKLLVRLVPEALFQRRHQIDHFAGCNLRLLGCVIGAARAGLCY